MAPAIDPIELAWAAGFFDGEGCFSTDVRRERGTCRVTVTISQTDPRPLERFADAVGVGRVVGPYEPSHGQRKRRWIYHSPTKAGAGRIAEVLWPYLSAPKREQYERALAKINEARVPEAA